MGSAFSTRSQTLLLCFLPLAQVLSQGPGSSSNTELVQMMWSWRNYPSSPEAAGCLFLVSHLSICALFQMWAAGDVHPVIANRPDVC